MKSNIP